MSQCIKIYIQVPIIRSMNQWISESTNQWTNGSTIQRVNGSMNQWITESMVHRFSESMSQSFTESVNHWMNDWLIEWMIGWLTDWLVDWLIDWLVEWMNEWLPNEWLNEWMSEWVSEWLNDWMIEWLNDWMNEWMSEWVSEWLNDWMIEWMNEWMDGRMNEWINHWINSSINHSIVRPHLPKVLWNPRFLTFLCEIGLSLQSRARFSLRTRPHKKSRCEHVSFFYGFYVKSSSRYSLVHILATSSSESAPKATVFWRFLSETDLSLQSRAHVANPIFQKSSERDSFSNANRACALFVDNFCRSRSAPAETKTPLRRPRVLPEKTEGSRPRIFSSLNLRVPELLHFRWWCGWHDDVVDIIYIYIIYYVVAMIGALYYTHYLYLCGLFRILEMICFIRLITPDMIMNKWTKWSYQ